MLDKSSLTNKVSSTEGAEICLCQISAFNSINFKIIVSQYLKELNILK